MHKITVIFLIFLSMHNTCKTKNFTITINKTLAVNKTFANLVFTSTAVAGIMVAYVCAKKLENEESIRQEILNNTSLKDLVSPFFETKNKTRSNKKKRLVSQKTNESFFGSLCSTIESITQDITHELNGIQEGLKSAQDNFETKVENRKVQYGIFLLLATITTFFSLNALFDLNF